MQWAKLKRCEEVVWWHFRFSYLVVEILTNINLLGWEYGNNEGELGTALG